MTTTQSLSRALLAVAVLIGAALPALAQMLRHTAGLGSWSRLSPHTGSGPVAHTVTRGQLTGLWHALVGERQLPLHEIAIHPYHAVSTHDRVDGVRLQREGVRVRACDSSAREEVETPLAARMAVNHAYRSLPSIFLARPLRNDTRLRRLGRFDVGRRDAAYQHHGASHVADHASHELGGVRPELQREIATG